MKQNVGSRLPAFTPLESKQVKGSADFLGLIYYTSITVKDKSSSLDGEPRDFNRDMAVELISTFSYICIAIYIACFNGKALLEVNYVSPKRFSQQQKCEI